MTKQTKYIAAVVLQLLILFVIIIFKLSVLTSGTEVMLRIQPVDPRDMLRGDYATFSYEISNVDSRDASIQNGDTVYVTLYPSSNRYYATNASKTRPTDGELYIKGKVESGADGNNNNPYYYYSRLHIVYGIEQYFIPEGTGRTMSFWNHTADARVAIDANGNAVLKKIYVDDKPWP